MSYILDALKKSEQERGHGTVPGVQTIHSSSLNYAQQKKPVWPWFILALLLLNAAAIFFFMQSQQATKAVAVEKQPAETTAAPVPAVTAEQTSQPAIVEPQTVVTQSQPQLITPSETVVAEEAVKTETPEPPVSTATMDVVEYYDLPLNIRQYIPEMTFSAHVYSSNAKQRSLVINGSFMEEGDEVTEGLVLREITRDGAIFDFRGHRFRQSVLAGWN